MSKTVIKKILFCIVCAIIAGAFVSVSVAVYYYVKADNISGNEMTIEMLKNAEPDHECYKAGPEAEIAICFESPKFIHKLQYQYSIDSDHRVTIGYQGVNSYGDTESWQDADYIFPDCARSVINVNRKVNQIVLKFDSKPGEMLISNIVVKNEFSWNPVIALFFAIAAFLISGLLVFRKECENHAGVTAGCCIFLLSLCMLIVAPPYMAGWDEEIHFANSYYLGAASKGEPVSEIVHYFQANHVFYKLCHTGSVEEKADMISNISHLGYVYGTGINTYKISIYDMGYFFIAIALKIGTGLHLPFFLVWIMGKLANVIVYAVCMGISISIIPVGKKILSVVALLPTMIFLSSTYTYDILVISLITLGMCVFIREAVYQNTVFSYKWRILFLSCIIIGCMPKAVYIPLVLGALFLPEAKFYSKKDKYIFKSIIVLVFIAMMMTFIVPSLVTGSMTGDTRGGDTSVGGQINYVLGHPVVYTKILLKSIWDRLVDYTVGTGGGGQWAHWGNVPFYALNTALITFAIAIDKCSEKGKQLVLAAKYRIILLITVFMTICLIWTALYISFTSVGATEIQGVQGRYYLPFIFILYLCISRLKISKEENKEAYQLFIFLWASGLMLLQMIYIFLIPSCL